MTYDLYENWVGTAKLTDMNQAIEYGRSLLAYLPQYNKFMLQYLCSFLVKVASQSEQNKMASSNLSIVFGPNILVKRDADPYDTSDFRHVYGLVQLLIDHY